MSEREASRFHPLELIEPRFKPVLSMRPHHFWLPEFEWAMLGVDPAVVTSRLMARIDTTAYTREYISDLFGKADPWGREHYREAALACFTKLNTLPDDSFIQLDLAPDDFCRNACAVGKHCTGTNYVFAKYPTDVVLGEEKSIERTIDALQRSGALHDEDFIKKDTYHELYNFGGRPLDTEPDFKGHVIFTSLIARVGALRRAYSFSD